jgi:hypothetical protein
MSEIMLKFMALNREVVVKLDIIEVSLLFICNYKQSRVIYVIVIFLINEYDCGEKPHSFFQNRFQLKCTSIHLESVTILSSFATITIIGVVSTI